MKKMNIFAAKKHRSSDAQLSPPATDTLHRIVNAKEEARRKWEEEQEMFDRRRREFELKMVDMERAEVVRREDEIRRRRDELDDKRRKNRLVQDTVMEQIRSLQQKLEEYKIKHKEEEETMDDDISVLEDKLLDVKSTLESRIQTLQCDEKLDPVSLMSPPSAPHKEDDFDGPSGAYPTLPVPQSRSLMSGLDESGQYLQRHFRSSRLSGPISGSRGPSSNESSSRSNTPRTEEQTSSDFDATV